MLPIEELVRFGDGLDSEYRHPVAGEFATRWGTAPPKFVRSSATHVFVAARGNEDRLVLRLRPSAAADVLHRASQAATEWSAAGAPMVPGVASLGGRAVETVGGYAAMALEAAEGTTLSEREDDLADHAADWGEALARLHAARLTTPGLPGSSDLPLPRTPEVFGTLHGDPEADNVVLTADGPVFVDPDEVRVGWFAADVAFALRDWAAPGKAPDLSADVPRRFVDGYRRVRALSDEELSWLPMLASDAARIELAQHQVHLRRGTVDDWPDWAVLLERRIRDRADLLRASLGTM